MDYNSTISTVTIITLLMKSTYITVHEHKAKHTYIHIHTIIIYIQF